MWTSSYVLVAAGWSLLLFALFYWAMEQRGWGKQGMGQAARLAVAGLRIERHRCVYDQRTAGQAIEMIQFTSGAQRMDVLRFVYFHLFMPIPDPGWRAFALFGRLYRRLLCPGVAALPQKDLRKDMICLRRIQRARLTVHIDKSRRTIHKRKQGDTNENRSSWHGCCAVWERGRGAGCSPAILQDLKRSRA